MSCCLGHHHPNLIITHIAFEKGAPDKLHLKGIVDNTPPTVIGRLLRVKQWMELIEKIAEVADEAFHLFRGLLEKFTSAVVYETLHNLHNASHEIEHLLHSFCIIGDLLRLLEGNFLEYLDKQKEKLDLVRSVSRVCHAVSHCLATLQYLSDLNLFKSGAMDKIFKFAPLFSALGYALWTATLVWRRYLGEENEHFYSDLGIHGGGLLFEALPLTKQLDSVAPYSFILSKIAAAAGIIHAVCTVDRLLPQYQEKVKDTITVPEKLFAATTSSGKQFLPVTTCA